MTEQQTTPEATTAEGAVAVEGPHALIVARFADHDVGNRDV